MGTLAIDLGSTTTVVAYQGESDKSVQLIDLNPISRIPGEVPSLIWKSGDPHEKILFGYQVERLTLLDRNDPSFISDFKRWIGAPNDSIQWDYNLLPEEAGELLVKEIWEKLPSHLEITRLVLTAPVETYKAYRKWLNKICFELDVKEIALVDEPTAAAIGAGQKGGSKLLVVDIGGSTTDMSIVLLEGGEGQADPIAQLIRFNGEDLEGKSKQVLRCAKVLGKAGLRLGGRDLDKWISHHLLPDTETSTIILDAAEKLKCKLSDSNLSETKKLTEYALISAQGDTKELSINRLELEELLLKKGLIKSLSKLLEKTIAQGSANGCELEDLSGVVLVGGGSRIPMIRRWLQRAIEPAKLITPPPIEAVAIGALSLTPGVKIRDVLHKGVSLRCWDQKTKQHIWHPLFLPGQPWPTNKPLEIILAASKGNQQEIDLKIGDYEIDGTHEVIYINGIPMIRDEPSQPKLIPWEAAPLLISLNPPGEEGADCLKLRFSIDDHCNLIVEGTDIRNEEGLISQNLGALR